MARDILSSAIAADPPQKHRSGTSGRWSKKLSEPGEKSVKRSNAQGKDMALRSGETTVKHVSP